MRPARVLLAALGCAHVRAGAPERVRAALYMGSGARAALACCYYGRSSLGRRRGDATPRGPARKLPVLL